MCLSVQLTLDAFLKVFVWLILLFRVLLFTTDVHFFFCCVGESNYNFLVSEYYLCDVLNNVLIFNFVIRFLNLVLHLSFTPKHSKICLLWLLLEDLALFLQKCHHHIFFLASLLQKFHIMCFFSEKLSFLSLIQNENSEMNSVACLIAGLMIKSMGDHFVNMLSVNLNKGS